MSKHFRDTQFRNLGATYLHQSRAKYAGLLVATNEVVRRHDMQAWPHTAHVTLPQAPGHPWGGKVAAFLFFPRETHYTHEQALHPGMWARVTSAVRPLTGLRHVPETQKLLRAAMTE